MGRKGEHLTLVDIRDSDFSRVVSERTMGAGFESTTGMDMEAGEETGLLPWNDERGSKFLDEVSESRIGAGF